VALSATTAWVVKPSTSACAGVISWRCPWVSRQRTGLPKASTTAWIRGLNPPRERPKAWGRLFLGASGVLVSAYRGAIHQKLLQIRTDPVRLKKALPDPLFHPTRKAHIYAIPLPKVQRQIPPWCPGASHPQPRFQKQPVVFGRHTAAGFFARKQMLDPFHGSSRRINRSIPIIQNTPIFSCSWSNYLINVNTPKCFTVHLGSPIHPPKSQGNNYSREWCKIFSVVHNQLAVRGVNEMLFPVIHFRYPYELVSPQCGPYGLQPIL
jgi:hypothetical protein